jgi:KTSC domain
MNRIPVQSSNLRSIGYEAETELLEVEFRTGGLYEYSGVPPEVHAALMSAQSHGSYFSREIRNRYPGRMLN